MEEKEKFPISKSFIYGAMIAIPIVLLTNEKARILFFEDKVITVCLILLYLSSIGILWCNFSINALEKAQDYIHYFIDAYVDMMTNDAYSYVALKKLGEFLPDNNYTTPKYAIEAFVKSNDRYEYFKNCLDTEKIKIFNRYMKKISKADAVKLINIDNDAKNENFLVKHYILNAMFIIFDKDDRKMADLYITYLKLTDLQKELDIQQREMERLKSLLDSLAKKE